MNLHSGDQWSEMDLFDLKNCCERGDSVQDIAEFLCRDEKEVRDKIAELLPKPSPDPRH